jgi:hypothetical protein
MNEAVLNAVEGHALTPEAVEHVIQLTERDDLRDRRSNLEREATDVGRRIKRLVEVIEDGDNAESLVDKLKVLELRKRQIAEELRALQPIPQIEKKIVEDRLAAWRRLLRQSTTQGRAVLQRVLKGRLRFVPRPEMDGYDFSGPTRFDKLFVGIAVEPPAWIGSTEAPTFGPEDTFDGDYGRLLERAHEQLLEKRGKGG